VFLSRDNWTSRRRLPSTEAIRLPEPFQGDISDDLILQAAMMKVNPATAYGLLKRFAELKTGDWIVQDVANSAVGLCVVRLAKNAGIKTINIIRSDAAAAMVKDAGGDVTMQDGDDLSGRVRAAAGGPVKLAIDAIAGSICDRLADCLAPGSNLVTYGRMSGQPCQITSRHLIYGEITLKGFWLGTMLRELNRAELTALYADLGRQVAAGDLASPIEATYAIDDIKAAVAHAHREGRSGKILVRPTGV
jgi:trans-2-enoyl-CoA reductase